MIRSFFRLLRQISRRLVVRVLLIAALSLLALALSILLAPFLPEDVALTFGAGSLDTILNTLAGSMLAVTTFSLSVMTSAYHAASQNATPRARAVLREDPTTQTVLATFVGAFLFALIGIILRATPLMGERESFVLFLFAIVVVGMVILAMVRWINHLETLGSLESTVLRLHGIAAESAAAYAQAPAHGCMPWSAQELALWRGRPAITANRSGYVQQIFEEALQQEAENSDRTYRIAVQPGAYVLEGMPLLYVEGGAPPEGTGATILREAFLIRAERACGQDSLHGVIALTEVASRALSPGINDPRTAIDVVHKLSDVLWRADPSAQDAPPAPPHDRLWLVPCQLEAFYRASFDIIARDAGKTEEVRQALSDALRCLELQSGPEGRAEAARCRTRLDLDTSQPRHEMSA